MVSDVLPHDDVRAGGRAGPQGLGTFLDHPEQRVFRGCSLRFRASVRTDVTA